MIDDLPTKAADLFDDNGAALEGAEIMRASLSDSSVTLVFQHNRSRPAFAIQIWQDSITGKMRVEYDEPPGAGADPYDRPDPMKHPEAWTE
jgi:hypothetical protein